ncbi:methyl-accepting chemotaxis protein (plasmid) [Alicyclobacillus fastidiosus]|uniref:Methyl-accepting chemotaxis protein n=1 Tax=Alicyclobacillus fastidiosus TaxID=392011 RepID=A0ABY6ZPN0_9BACL|nr:methyl-accepting chemotaxis protein [Alicyclobacillus fastidiosus]WAH44940.1 methyl-accepting chemotaxis protein [Alicyclobacillus fastidiosus]GMA65593.1 chemotaxis protein [Alicyclobacillus fastidiosus]GMA65709.1 chemotaxis protein [Alicyclobacillus fastidiosus]
MQIENERKSTNTLFSIRTKLMSIALLMLVVPSLVVGIISYNVAHNQLNSSSKIALQNDVKLVNNTISILNSEVQAGQISLASAQEQVKRMVLGPVQSNGMRPINPDYNIGNHRGFFYILNTKGDSLASPTSEGKNIWNSKDANGFYMIQAVIKAAQSGGGFTTYQWPLPNNPKQLSQKIVYSDMAPAWGWVIAVGSYTSDFNSGANHVLTNMLITLVISLILGAVIIVLFANRLSRPIKQMATQVEKVAQGDLGIEPLHFKNRDEIGVLARGFNLMTTSLKEVISKVSMMSDQLAASSEELSASTDENSKAIEQVTSTIQEVAVGAENQGRSVEETVKTIGDLTNGMNVVAKNAEDVSQSAAQASQAADEGNQTIQLAIEKMNSIETAMNNLSGVVLNLGERSSEIGKIVETIEQISSQTNLLSLNAAIEAARAGESGRGFAVVASEVRKLAEQSARATQHISEIIGGIQYEAKDAVESMEIAKQEVSSGLDTVDTAGHTFEGIKSSVDSVANQIQEVSISVSRMLEGTTNLHNVIQDVSHVTATTTTGVETVSAASQEQLASIEEIAASANSLSQMAEELQHVISRFKM